MGPRDPRRCTTPRAVDRNRNPSVVLNIFSLNTSTHRSWGDSASMPQPPLKMQSVTDLRTSLNIPHLVPETPASSPTTHATITGTTFDCQSTLLALLDFSSPVFQAHRTILFSMNQGASGHQEGPGARIGGQRLMFETASIGSPHSCWWWQQARS